MKIPLKLLWPKVVPENFELRDFSSRNSSKKNMLVVRRLPTLLTDIDEKGTRMEALSTFSKGQYKVSGVIAQPR